MPVSPCTRRPQTAPVDTSAAPASVGATPQLWRRMACWLYEGLLLFGLIFVAGYLFGALSQTRHALDQRHALQVFLLLVAGIYCTWFWSRGQTLAQKTWQIRVLDRSGRPPTQSRALLRYALSWLWFLPPLAALAPFALPAGESALVVTAWVAVWALLSRLHPERQFWHDALAGTRLVHCARASK